MEITKTFAVSLDWQEISASASLRATGDAELQRLFPAYSYLIFEVRFRVIACESGSIEEYLDIDAYTDAAARLEYRLPEGVEARVVNVHLAAALDKALATTGISAKELFDWLLSGQGAGWHDGRSILTHCFEGY